MNYGNKAQALRRNGSERLWMVTRALTVSVWLIFTLRWETWFMRLKFTVTANDSIRSNTNICTCTWLTGCHSLRCLKSALVWLKMSLIPKSLARGPSKSTSSSAVNLLREEEEKHECCLSGLRRLHQCGSDNPNYYKS